MQVVAMDPRRRTLTVSALPEDIYRCIQEFTSINALLNTSKRLIDVKHRLFYWSLGSASSQQFYSSEEFCERLRGLMHDCKKQLSLNLGKCDKVSDVSALGHVHTLNLSSCPNVSVVSALGHVHTLNLSACVNVRDVSALGHVHTLNLSACKCERSQCIGPCACVEFDGV
jgi:hypothetical protein